MTPIVNNILVEVDLTQNEEFNGRKSGRNYNENFRERNPVIAKVIEGLGEIKTGAWIVCNYNYFEEESPLLLTDNLFSIPVNEEIFALVKDDGSLYPVCGNIFVERVTKETPIEIPNELKRPHTNRGIISVGAEGFYKNQYVFWLEKADYEIVYQWRGKEFRAIKVHKTEIVGYLKN